MTTEIPLPIALQQYRSRPASPARLVNCHVEELPPGARARYQLSRSPGVKTWTTVGSGPIVGMYEAGIEFSSGRLHNLYVVSGSELYSVDSDKNATLLGDVGTPVRVDIDSNVDSLVVVNQPNAYHWNGAAFAQITDHDFVTRGAGDVEFLDNFMLFREPDSARFFGADLGSVSDFDALSFGIADAAPDELVGMEADHRQLLNFGTKTTEIWENTGGTGFPFSRLINGTIQEGCLNSKTIAKQDNSVYWVADDYTVRRLEGITPVRVSTHSIEQKIAAATADSAEAFAYDLEGHFIYALTFNEGTYLLDVTTGEWTERETYGQTNWRARHHVQFAGKELVGDGTSNKIGELDPETYTEWDDPLVMEWTYQTVYAMGQRAFHDRLEITLETGVGLQTGQGSDPKLVCQYSDDGLNWKTLPERSIGAIGDREVRVFWHNLGSSRQRVYRCYVSDPVPVTLTSTLLTVRGGRL